LPQGRVSHPKVETSLPWNPLNPAFSNGWDFLVISKHLPIDEGTFSSNPLENNHLKNRDVSIRFQEDIDTHEQ